eukprot:scaffold210485_cov15-Tisochrysis_lutea.AAC.1
MGFLSTSFFPQPTDGPHSTFDRCCLGGSTWGFAQATRGCGRCEVASLPASGYTPVRMSPFTGMLSQYHRKI